MKKFHAIAEKNEFGLAFGDRPVLYIDGEDMRYNLKTTRCK